MSAVESHALHLVCADCADDRAFSFVFPTMEDAYKAARKDGWKISKKTVQCPQHAKVK